MSLTKKEKLQRLNYIMSRPEFITCENGHVYLPISLESEFICPICIKEQDTDNINYNDYDNDIDEFVSKFDVRDVYFDD